MPPFIYKTAPLIKNIPYILLPLQMHGKTYTIFLFITLLITKLEYTFRLSFFELSMRTVSSHFLNVIFYIYVLYCNSLEKSQRSIVLCLWVLLLFQRNVKALYIYFFLFCSSRLLITNH